MVITSKLVAEEIKTPQSIDDNGMPGAIGISKEFAITMNKLITRDLNSNTSRNSGLTLFSKEQISDFLQDPSANEKQLRDAVIYIYGASSHFRRLIQYFAGLSDLAYVVSPTDVNPKTANSKTISSHYRKVLHDMEILNIQTQGRKILLTCLREDVFYGTMWVTKDDITIQQLPSDYCKISSIEGKVFNVTFNFKYFDQHKDLLEFYPPEFNDKYRIYRNNKNKMAWQELDAPKSFAIKCNNDIPDYAIPPFAGILREVYDLEEYKQLKLTKTNLENYAMLVMTLGIDEDGNWQMDLAKAKEFWRNLDGVLPDEIGSILTPMPINKISFERTTSAESHTISDAEQNLFSAAGVSSLLFNNDKASANALALSVKADQDITYSIVKSIEDALNRYIHSLSYGKNFKVTFLDCSRFNRKELSDLYLKACQFGIPMISYFAATQGLGQAELDNMSFLETEVLGLTDMFTPLKSSSTMSNEESKGATDEGGAPRKDGEELTEQGEQHREDE